MKCSICDKDFVPNELANGVQVYCGADCRAISIAINNHLNRKSTKKIIKCKCGKEFSAYKRKFCSSRCENIFTKYPKGIKKCPICEENKNAFIGKFCSAKCRVIQMEALKKIRDNNKPNAKNAPNTQLFIRKVKNKFGCKDCKQKFDEPSILEFHHLDPSQKTSSISMMVRFKCSIKEIKEEIRKCDLVCANCHRRRTAKRRAEQNK